MCETMKFVTSSSSSTIDIPVDYIYVESLENKKQVYSLKSNSVCDNCPNNQVVCNCTLNCTLNYTLF